MHKVKAEFEGSYFGYKASFILIFGIIYINNSLMFEELFSATFRGIVTIIIFALTFIVCAMTRENGWKVHIDRRAINFYTLAVLCVVLCILVNGIRFESDVYTLILLTIALGVTAVISSKMFYRIFVDVMIVFAIGGVVCFLMYAVAPSLFSAFPVYTWHGEMLIKNCYFCVISIATQNYRNFGIFREPGMFSVFLVFALLIEMFFNKPDIKKVIVLFVALLTTLSTNGYICAILLLVAFLTTHGIKDNTYLKRNRRKIILALIVLVVCGVGFLSVNSQARVFLLGKLSEISVGDSVNSTTTGSGYERYRSIVYAIEAFLSNPLFGIGYTGWSESFSGIIMTATPINWFGLRGVIYGVMMNWFYFKNGFGIDKQVGGVVTKVLLCVVLLCNIISQNMSSDIIMYLLILYQCIGITKTNNSEE